MSRIQILRIVTVHTQFATLVQGIVLGSGNAAALLVLLRGGFEQILNFVVGKVDFLLALHLAVESCPACLEGVSSLRHLPLFLGRNKHAKKHSAKTTRDRPSRTGRTDSRCTASNTFH